MAQAPAIAVVEIEYAEEGAENAGYQAYDTSKKPCNDADNCAEDAGKNTDNSSKNAKNYGYHQDSEKDEAQYHQDFHNRGR